MVETLVAMVETPEATVATLVAMVETPEEVEAHQLQVFKFKQRRK